MSLIPVIIDHALAYPHVASGACSLCSLPLASGTVLDYLLTRLKGMSMSYILLAPTLSMKRDESAGRRQTPSSAVTVYTPEEFAHHIASYETEDYVLLIDPRRWPAAGHNLEKVPVMLRDYRAVTHVVGFCANKERIREVADCTHDGRIKRLQRLYDSVLWPQAASTSIAYSLIPVQMMTGIPFLSLAQLRRDLSVRGVLSRDLPLSSKILDLADEMAYLSISDQLVVEMVDNPPRDLTIRAPGILVGRNCRIHPSARLIAPMVIQADVTVEEDVTIVGPALVGAGSRLRKGSTVAQAVLASRTDISPKTTILHQVVAGHCSGDMAHEAYWPEPSGDAVGILTKEAATAGDIVFQSNQLFSRKRYHFVVKRFLDIVLSLIALIVLAPLFVIVALLIKLDSRGPVFFKHRRETRNGKEFSCYKFRTMTENAHHQQRFLYSQNELDGPQFKLRNDPRVTRIGSWMRAMNIDELPQLFNVLLGHMSLVGPRPSPFRENQICIPWRQARLSVRPGITGLWQICRDNRAGGGFHQWIFYDLAYVKNFSIWLDIKILIATLLSLSGHWTIPISWLINQPRRISVYST